MMDRLESLFAEDVSNPLDGVEELLNSQNWTFNRMNRDELFLELKGAQGLYRMMFVWDDHLGAMQFCAEFDLCLGDANYDHACRVINGINSGLWLGHFDMAEENMVPCFRHTQLFRGQTQSSGLEYVQDIIESAITECDRHYALFMMLAKNERNDDDDMTLALMPVAGRS